MSYSTRAPAALDLRAGLEYSPVDAPHTPPAPLTPRLFSSSPSGSPLLNENTLPALNPPSQPQTWLWACHLCDTRYPLGVTRRCLNDGHYFCAGESPSKNKKKRKRRRNRPCSSEFDYAGWEEYGDWRRGVKDLEFEFDGEGKNCADYCNFPSQCRWSKRVARMARAEEEVEIQLTVTASLETSVAEPGKDMGMNILVTKSTEVNVSEA